MIKFNEITAENVKLMELAFKDMLAHIGVNVDVKVFGNECRTLGTNKINYIKP